MVNVRMDGGTRVRLWTSSVAVGRLHGLNIRSSARRAACAGRSNGRTSFTGRRVNGRTEVI